MNALKGLKFTLENFSTEKEFSFVYKVKTQIITRKKYKGVDEDYYIYYHNKEEILGNRWCLFKIKDNDRESFVNLFNELVSKNKSFIEIKIKIFPTTEIHQALARILLEKVAHIDDKDFKADNLSEADEKKC